MNTKIFRVESDYSISASDLKNYILDSLKLLPAEVKVYEITFKDEKEN